MRNIWLCVAAIALATGNLDGQEPAKTGTIVGTVVNEMGTAVEGARVRATALNSGPRLAVAKWVITDSRGAFSIDELEFGAYRVDAMKPADGYANTGFEFHDNSRQPKPVLSAWIPKVAVLVILGPKAGVIAGPVSDAVSGKPVNATFHMWRFDRPERTGYAESATSPCNVLVPPDVEVGLEVLAPGYEPWYYPGDGVFPRSMPIKLKPGEKQEIDIKLRPIQPSAGRGPAHLPPAVP